MSFYYPYYGYPYFYDYPPYYSVPLLANEYKLNGLYNELDELNDVEAMYGRDMPMDASMNHGLHVQLKHKNAELAQHVVRQDREIFKLLETLKKHNIQHDISGAHVHDLSGRHFHPRPCHCPMYCRHPIPENPILYHPVHPHNTKQNQHSHGSRDFWPYPYPYPYNYPYSYPYGYPYNYPPYYREMKNETGARIIIPHSVPAINKESGPILPCVLPPHP